MGGMDPYSSPDIVPNNSPHNPFPHSLLRTRQPAKNLKHLQYNLIATLKGTRKGTPFPTKTVNNCLGP